MNSTNGTLVNGQAIKKHFLRNMDVVELGKYKLKYMSDISAAGLAQADAEKTMILRPGVNRSPEQKRSFTDTQSHVPKPPPTPVASPSAAIQLLNGGNAGKELELTKTLTTLGKPGMQVAVIAKRPHGYFITHVEGAQFPVVNGESLDAQAHLLKDHDVIEIAGIKMEFFLKA
jgi:pSer/pThr/pTyr-binding forkhead associated (FHA) protein